MTSAAQVDLKLLTQIANPVIEGAGYELVDLEWKREAGAWILRFFIDKPGGPHAPGEGITLDACAEVSTDLSTVLDVSDALPGSDTYSLEVSSPGIDRPLRREADFRRSIGQKVKMRTLHPLGPPPGRRNYAGILTDVTSAGGSVALFIDVGDRTCEVPLPEVEKANLVYEFTTQQPGKASRPKPGQSSRGQSSRGKTNLGNTNLGSTSHGSGGSR